MWCAFRRPIAVPFINKFLKIRRWPLAIPSERPGDAPRINIALLVLGSSATAYSQAFITWAAWAVQSTEPAEIVPLKRFYCRRGPVFQHSFMKAALASVTRLLCSRFSPRKLLPSTGLPIVCHGDRLRARSDIRLCRRIFLPNWCSQSVAGEVAVETWRKPGPSMSWTLRSHRVKVRGPRSEDVSSMFPSGLKINEPHLSGGKPTEKFAGPDIPPTIPSSSIPLSWISSVCLESQLVVWLSGLKCRFAVRPSMSERRSAYVVAKSRRAGTPLAATANNFAPG